MRTTRIWIWASLLSRVTVLALFVNGCTTGPLKVAERYFMAETDGTNTNYLRITVQASTQLSKAEFRQGWFPAAAVDQLFGDVSQEGEGKALLLKEQLKKQIDEALKEADGNYRALAKVAKTPVKDLQESLAATNRVLLLPRPTMGRLGHQSRLMEYDPRRGFSTLHGDEKLVFFLSANPNEIVTKIGAFAAQNETEKTVQKLMGAIAPAINRDLVVKTSNAAAAGRIDSEIVKQIDAALTALTATATRDQGLAEVERLLALLRTVQRGPRP